jgi:dihydrofolate synthase/folylpolyglutamate synthase
MSKNAINLGLERILELLKRLDNCHLKLPPTIHIAGTNGKGSTLSFLKNIFIEANLKVHTYTSPHLVKFNERITLANQEISDEFLNEVLEKCHKARDEEPKIDATFFEITTAAAFLAFAKVKADILILETGLGGRLDATNVLPQVLCSIITPIDFDHQEFLGNSLEKIAFEKAGIIKENCPVIIGKQKDEALKVLKNQALKLNCKTQIFNQDFAVENLNLKLKGSHQLENAAVAKQAALEQKLFVISQEIIKKGLEKTLWKARLEKINSGKFFDKLPNNFELYLDGSHNLQGANTVLEFLESQKNKKIFVIFGMLKNKNCEGFLKIISKNIEQLIALEISEEENCYKTKEIIAIAKNNKINAISAQNFDDAFKKIKCEEPSIILILGSLYLAGEFLNLSAK